MEPKGSSHAFPKPWFRKSRESWFVEFNGKQINLGRDKEAAFEKYRKRLAAPPETLRVVDSSLVVVLCDNFLGWVEKHRSAATCGWYLERLQEFASKYPHLTVDEQQGYIDTNPIAEMETPSAGRRENTVSKVEFDEIFGCVRNDALRDLLVVSYETGYRPQESLRVEARHLDSKNQPVLSSEQREDRALAQNDQTGLHSPGDLVVQRRCQSNN